MKLTLRALLGRDGLRLRLMNGDADTVDVGARHRAPGPHAVPQRR